MPVPDYGGLRVDTNANDEVARWIFPKAMPGLARLAQTIDRPGYLLKLCGSAGELAALLPGKWAIHPPGYFMKAAREHAVAIMTAGYTITVKRSGAVTRAQIFCDTGALAAEGYAAETADVFIFDRIVTQPAHRRKGLARALLSELHTFRQNDSKTQVLVATEAGRALYAALGWQTISPYTTASRLS